MVLHEADQLAAKASAVEGALRRPVDAVVASPRSLGYRARLALRTDRVGRAGYHRPGTHEHVAIDACALARPEVATALGRLQPLPRGVDRIELRSDGERVIAVVDSDARRAPDVLSALAGCGLSGVSAGRRVLTGDPMVRLELGGIRHELSPTTFYQVNLEVNALLVAAVAQAAADLEATTVLDLYSGCGNLSLPLAAAGTRVVQIESAGSAARDARRTAARQGLDVEVRTGDAGAFQAGDAFYDVAILDPPRAGAPGLLAELLTTRPAGVIYVSCNPRALGRDLGAAAPAGYRVERITLFDMFPQTPHAEVLCVLRRA